MAIIIHFSDEQKQQLKEHGAMSSLGTRVFNDDGSEINDITSIEISIKPNEVIYARLEIAVDAMQVPLGMGVIYKEINIFGKIKYRFIGLLKRCGVISYI